MQPIVQSLFFKALAFALLSSIWQMALIWVTIVLIVRIFKLTAAQKFNVAFAGQLTGFILFIYCLIYYYKNADASLYFNNIFYSDKLNDFTGRLMPFISIAYMIVLMYQFLKLFFSYNCTQQLRKHNLEKMPATGRIFIQQITGLLSLKKKVSIYLSTAIQCPLTIGFFKPVILVPLAAINHLTKEQMEAVLLHEMAHIKRHDYFLNLIQSFIEKIFFFNIFSKMIDDIIEHERENACDDFVLQFRYNAFHYAEALLKLGRLQTMSSLAMAASGKKENVLLLRVKRLVHRNNQQNINYSFKTFAFCYTALIFILPLMIASHSKIHLYSTASINKKTIVATSVRKQETTAKIFAINNEQPTALSNNPATESINKKPVEKQSINARAETAVNNELTPPQYFNEVNNISDSLKQISAVDASTRNIILNDDTYKKALSYQNFKQLEAMLQASGKSITITEDPALKDSYKKLITIEAKDANGNLNIYKVIVELYQ